MKCQTCRNPSDRRFLEETLYLIWGLDTLTCPSIEHEKVCVKVSDSEVCADAPDDRICAHSESKMDENVGDKCANVSRGISENFKFEFDCEGMKDKSSSYTDSQGVQKDKVEKACANVLQDISCANMNKVNNSTL